MAAPRNSRSTDLPRALAAFLTPRLSSAAATGPVHLCVALSGGRDSVALLHALVQLRGADRGADSSFRLSALHVHHGLSPDADHWTAFCDDLCAAIDVPLTTVRARVDTAAGEGLEAAARHARYKVFEQCDADLLVLAHHRDDQAETLLLNLLRGAGVAGLAGMPAERPLGIGRPLLVRPLLDVSRDSIDAYLQAHDLRWVDDESNDDVRLRRNFLRHDILPRLVAHFPGALPALARAASLLQQEARLADEIAEQDRAAVASGGGFLLAPFLALPPARRANLLRHELRLAGTRMPDARHLDEVLRQLAEAGGDAQPRLQIDGIELRVHRGQLHVVPLACGAPQAKNWRGETRLPWGRGEVRFDAVVGEGISQARLASAEVILRARAGGERFQRSFTTPRRALKKLLQESEVPAWEREQLPLLCCGDVLVWVGGLGVDAGWQAAPGEAGVLPVWMTTAPGA